MRSEPPMAAPGIDQGKRFAIAAKPWLYRSRKFLERHAVGATAAVLVFLLIAGLTGYYTLRIQR